MEITSFILGVCAVIVIMMVVGTFVNYMTTTSLKKEINSLQKQLEYTQMDLEKKDNHVWDGLNNVDRNLRDEMEKLYRHIDSRVDKVTDNISREIAHLHQELDKLTTEKSVING